MDNHNNNATPNFTGLGQNHPFSKTMIGGGNSEPKRVLARKSSQSPARALSHRAPFSDNISEQPNRASTMLGYSPPGAKGY